MLRDGIRGQANWNHNNRKLANLITWPTAAAATAAKSLQSCLTLCDPVDGSPPGSPVPGILQARTLEWAAISFSNAWKWKVKVKSLSHVWLFATRWTAAYQGPLSMGFPRQEYWSGSPVLNETKPWHVGPPKTDGSWWRGLAEWGPLEKGMGNHFSILALRTPWTVWKGKKMGHWKMNSPSV